MGSPSIGSVVANPSKEVLEHFLANGYMTIFEEMIMCPHGCGNSGPKMPLDGHRCPNRLQAERLAREEEEAKKIAEEADATIKRELEENMKKLEGLEEQLARHQEAFLRTK